MHGGLQDAGVDLDREARGGEEIADEFARVFVADGGVRYAMKGQSANNRGFRTWFPLGVC